MIVTEALLCFRLILDTGTVLEFWELDNGEFEILTIERRDEVVGAVTLTLVEAELLAEKLAMAIAPAAGERQET
jgi:PIN domain nuclease of toxin-antitoxin system